MSFDYQRSMVETLLPYSMGRRMPFPDVTGCMSKTSGQEETHSERYCRQTGYLY
jgi:hypothetical protein